MPFMIGKAPIRRTMEYLNAGKLMLKDKVKIMTVNYNTHGEHHEGARDFVFWYLPQIQFKNPSVQIATFKNMTPSPFMKFYLDDGNQMLVDIDGKTKEEVQEHLLKVIGKTDLVLAAEALKKEKKDNPANFGHGCDKACMCEIRGQIPCPGVIPLPRFMRGKYQNRNK